jgi:uncharacterized SAM-binding protein YcdF (DUF218 family)
MLITLIILSLLAGLTWKLTSSNAARKSLIFINLFIFIGISTGIVPEIMARHLAVSDPDEDQYAGEVAVILIGAGISESVDGKMTIPFYGYSRVVKTMTSYRYCIARKAQCSVIVSGGTPSGSQVSEARIYADALIEMGIPRTAISLEERSRNTWENAKYSLHASPIIFDSVYVVTNSLHANRTSLYFKHFNPSVITLASDPVPYRLNAAHWGLNWFIYDVSVHELIGIARYYVYQNLGLNKEPART